MSSRGAPFIVTRVAVFAFGECTASDSSDSTKSLRAVFAANGSEWPSELAADDAGRPVFLANDFN